MKTFFATLAFLLCFQIVSTFTHASVPVHNWHEGVVVLADSSVFRGEISYNHQYELLLLKEEQTIRTLTARQLKSFHYLDTEKNILHRYITLTYSPHPQVKQSSIFEVVLTGDVTYLRKHNGFPAMQEPQPSSASFRQGLNPHVVCYDYFAYYQDQLIPSSRFHKEVLPILLSSHAGLSEYIAQESLRPYDTGDQIRILQHVKSRSAAPFI